MGKKSKKKGASASDGSGAAGAAAAAAAPAPAVGKSRSSKRNVSRMEEDESGDDDEFVPSFVEDVEDEDGDDDSDGGMGMEEDGIMQERSFFAQKLDQANPAFSFDSDGPGGIQRQLRLAQVALAPNAKGGPFTLSVEVEQQSELLEEDEEPEEPKTVTCVLCTLIPGKVDQCQLELFFSEDAIFSISGKGKGEVYLSGDVVDTLDPSSLGDFDFADDDEEQAALEEAGIDSDKGAKRAAAQAAEAKSKKKRKVTVESNDDEEEDEDFNGEEEDDDEDDDEDDEEESEEEKPVSKGFHAKEQDDNDDDDEEEDSDEDEDDEDDEDDESGKAAAAEESDDDEQSDEEESDDDDDANAELKGKLQELLKSANSPKKKPKFKNFCKNTLKVANDADVEYLWTEYAKEKGLK